MIVKLTGHQSKLKFMKAKKHLRRNVSIKEDLTRENYELLKYVKTNSRTQRRRCLYHRRCDYGACTRS